MTNFPNNVFLLESLKSIVGVHEGVHYKVHDDEPPGGGRVLAEGVPAVDEHSYVVVPGTIKENEKKLNAHRKFQIS